MLGVQIIGPDSGTWIAEAVFAIEFGASAEDSARTCHAHPTLNETLKEAALAAANRGHPHLIPKSLLTLEEDGRKHALIVMAAGLDGRASRYLPK